MKRILELSLAVYIVANASATQLSAAEPALDGSTRTCVACHQERAGAHIDDWRQSPHARFGITCTSCHVIGEGTPHPAPSRSEGPSTACTSDRQTVMEICQRCHEDVAHAFRASPHYRHDGSAAPNPSCVTCHSSAGAHILAEDALAPRCGACHGHDGTAGKPWVATRAPVLLQLLRQVTLARTLVAERLDTAENRGKDVSAVRAEMRRVGESFRDIPFEWHRFDFRQVEARSSSTLEVLESLHAQLGEVSRDERLASAALTRASRERGSSPFTSGGGQPFRFAVSTMLGPVETYESYVGLFNDLGRALGRPHRFVQRRTYQEINDLLLRGELDLAFICSGAYVALPEDAPIEIVALPVVGGKSVYHSLIIVREGSPFRRFEDLKGSRFAFTDPLSNTGHLYPVFRLTELGTEAKSFFSSTLFSGSHDRSILAVYRGLVDAAAVDDLIYKDMVVPQSPYWQRLRIVESSPDFGIPPVVASTAVPVETRVRMREFLLGLEHTERGRRRLSRLGFDGFAEGSDQAYASIRRMREVTTAQTR